MRELPVNGEGRAGRGPEELCEAQLGALVLKGRWIGADAAGERLRGEGEGGTVEEVVPSDPIDHVADKGIPGGRAGSSSAASASGGRGGGGGGGGCGGGGKARVLRERRS